MHGIFRLILTRGIFPINNRNCVHASVFLLVLRNFYFLKFLLFFLLFITISCTTQLLISKVYFFGGGGGEFSGWVCFSLIKKHCCPAL